MLYGIKWYDQYHRRTIVSTGDSIPDALHRARMEHGANFTASDKLYGIIDVAGDFVRVKELDEPGRYKPKELDGILRSYYQRT